MRGGGRGGHFLPLPPVLGCLMGLVPLGQPEAHRVEVSRGSGPPGVQPAGELVVSQRRECCLPASKHFSGHQDSGGKGSEVAGWQEGREVRCVLYDSAGGITSQGESRRVVLHGCDCQFSLKIMSGFG